MSDFLKQILPSIPDKYINPRPLTPGVGTFGPIESPEPLPEPFITGDILRKIVLNLSAERANELANVLNLVLPRYGLDKKGVFHEYIAQVAHESGGFRYKVENLNYSAQGLLKIFPKYFNSSNVNNYARNPQKIANKVYANRMGNRDEASGDGWKNRGGGYIQLTGDIIWKAYAKYKGLPVDKIQELVRTTEEYAIDSSCWYFSIYASLNDEAERNEFLKITKAINGGTIGYQDRLDYYEKAKKYFPA